MTNKPIEIYFTLGIYECTIRMSAPPSFSIHLNGESLGPGQLEVPVKCFQPLNDSPINAVSRAAAAVFNANNYSFLPPHLISDVLVEEFLEKFHKNVEDFVVTNCDEIVKKTSSSSDFQDNASLVSKWRQIYENSWANFAKERNSSGGKDMPLVTFVESYLALAASQGLPWIFSEVQRLSTEWAELLLKQNTEEESLEREHRKLVDSLTKNGAVDASAINLAAREHIEARDRLQQRQRGDLADLHRALSQRLRLGVIAKASSLRLTSPEMNRSPASSIGAMESADFDSRMPSGSDVSFTANNLRQDSFTIALGTQVRSTANVKILSADLGDIVKSVCHVAKAQWLHNVMTLYSGDQSALVVMVDGDLSLYNEPIATINESTKPIPELHFPTYAEQVEQIAKIAIENGPSNQNEHSVEPSLEAGDFFATHHSNLSGVNVVFHLVWSDSQNSRSSVLDGGELTSRHPVIGGLRTLIKTCLEHDITSITVPLLLTTSTKLPESATLAWCARRAELVLKCIKGYLLEHTNHSGASSTACCFAGGIPLGTTAAELTAPGGRPPTIQFLVPKEISDELFHIFTQLITQIFRVSSPLILQASLLQQNSNQQPIPPRNSTGGSK